MVKHGPLIFEYSKIMEYIYIGTNMCCQPHFNKALLKKGIKADISLEEEQLDQPFGVKYYLWLPTKDHTAPTQKQLIVGANFIKRLVEQKIKCYVHCQRGHGRASTLVAAYIIQEEGMGVEKAVEFIKKKRPSIHLNKKHFNALKRFAKQLKKRS